MCYISKLQTLMAELVNTQGEMVDMFFYLHFQIQKERQIKRLAKSITLAIQGPRQKRSV